MTFTILEDVPPPMVSIERLSDSQLRELLQWPGMRERVLLLTAARNRGMTEVRADLIPAEEVK